MEACHAVSLALRGEMSRWIAQSRRMDGPGPHGGGEDEANYALAWFPHLLVTGDENAITGFRDLLDALAGWVARECVHGYEPQAEAHHGPEPFVLFLPRYLGLFPDDARAVRLLEDAAHHVGNWVREVPPWFDEEAIRFRNYFIGTRVVGEDPAFAYENAEHLRFLHLALAADRVLGEGRYRDWSLRYGRKWAERIVDAGDGPMPLIWDREGRGLRASELTTREQHILANTHHHAPNDPLAGIECLLASGAVEVFADLFALSGEPIFRDAARRIVTPLIDSLLDPYGDPAAAAIADYRAAFRDASLDGAIRAVIDRMPPESDAPLAMVFPEEHRRREPGVGRRADMIYWGEWAEDGSVRPTREPSTAALALAYQVTGEVAFARRAFASAATKLRMARRVLRGGREHADMGGAICSVAAGHGRNWGTGAVTGCYGRLLLGARIRFGAVAPSIEVRDADGRLRIPDGLLTLVRPPVDGPGEALFFNGSDAPIACAWRIVNAPGGEEWRPLTLAPKEGRRSELA